VNPHFWLAFHVRKINLKRSAPAIAIFGMFYGRSKERIEAVFWGKG